MRRPGFSPGTPAVLYLHSPKEKVWGLVVALDAAGIVIRGLDLSVFEDWVRQEARRDEPQIAPATIFYPMGRVERLEHDETAGPVVSCADRFAAEVGCGVRQAIGWPEDEEA